MPTVWLGIWNWLQQTFLLNCLKKKLRNNVHWKSLGIVEVFYLKEVYRMAASKNFMDLTGVLENTCDGTLSRQILDLGLQCHCRCFYVNFAKLSKITFSLLWCPTLDMRHCFKKVRLPSFYDSLVPGVH